MDAAGPISPAISTCSDDEAYNTENARLHFGPFKTPERRFTGFQLPSVLAPQTPPVRRSPRFSSPRPESNPQSGENARESEDADDMICVEELVGEMDEDDGSNNSGSEVRENLHFFPDEPSSVLAERISRAMDNPSPPPSPLPAIVKPDVLFATLNPEEYKEDDVFPCTNFDILIPDISPQIPADSSAPSPPPTYRVTEPVSVSAALNLSPQPDLINFDSFTTSSLPIIGDSGIPTSSPQSAVSSVDDLLLDSSVVTCISPTPALQTSPPAVIEQTVTQPSTQKEPEDKSVDQEAATNPVQVVQSNVFSESSTPPLRRSPRRSIAPNQLVFVAPSTPSPDRSNHRSPRKKEKRAAEPEIVEDSQDEGDAEMLLSIPPDSAALTPRGKDRSRSRSPLVFSRELGSLSPTTSHLLTQLLPSFTDTTPLQLNPQPLATSSIDPSSLRSPTPEVPPTTPQRSRSLLQILATPSPSKPLLQVSHLSGSDATPARRITMEEALQKGQISPVKAAQLGFTPRDPVFTAPQTPARRVLLSDKKAPAPPSTRSVLRFGSPTRGGPTEQAGGSYFSMSLGPPEQQRDKPNLFNQHALKPAAVSSQATSLLNVGQKLPFPIVATKAPASASGEKLVENGRPGIPTGSPLKSILKQTTSRIPRIGMKPYARPTGAVNPPLRKAPPAPKPTTLRKVDLSKPSSTKMVINVGLASRDIKGKGKETVAGRPGLPNGQVKGLDSNLLKRKRSPENKVVSPVKSRITALRQVPPVVIASNKASTSRRAGKDTAITTALKKPPARGAIPMRKVIDEPVPRTRSQAAPPPPETIPPETILPSESHPAHDSLCDEPTAVATEQPGSPMQDDTPTIPTSMPSVTTEHPSDSKVQPPPAIEIHPPHETPPIETLQTSTVEIPPLGVRRTTRARKAAQSADVFTEPAVRITHSRRKAAPRFRFTDAYSEMSSTALKSLTTSNTLRNQQYLAAQLETEIIRKEGERPESPAVKIKTIAQRQMEQKGKQRSERAQRRARRSGEVLPSSDLEMSSDDEILNSSDVDEMQLTPVRHRRGAGEEEDYESPERVFRRMRLTEDGPRAVEEIGAKRRVKWHRGLFTTVYLDQVELGSRELRKEIREVKGCLAPRAKSLRLDTLGNLPNVESPLGDIVPQNVVVKKFVYENDTEPILEEVVVKNTRSRSKKAKA